MKMLSNDEKESDTNLLRTVKRRRMRRRRRKRRIKITKI